MKKLLLLFFIITQNTIGQSKIELKTNFSDVKIYKLQGNTKLEPPVGVGYAKVKLDRKEPNRFQFEKEGYKTIIKEFPRSRKWPKTVNVNLTTRVVEVSVSPFDALIVLDGKKVGEKRAFISIPEGNEANIEVVKDGYESITKTYSNVEGKTTPPLKDEIKLINREVDVKITPLDGEIIVDKENKGIGSRKVVIPEGKCVIVEGVKDGYVGDEIVFCNKEGENIPENYSFVLEDRLVNVSSSPDDAEIKLNGKVLGIGNYSLKIPKDKCVEVEVAKEGYIKANKSYCNKSNYQEPPSSDFFELVEDEAYATSVSTDQANVKFTIAVREGMSELDAWKTLSQIITSEFDVLEVIDKETGYLRTAWQVQSFNGNSTIRTRVIVSLNDSSPLKYAMKISSERADGIVSAKDDQLFSEWNRILKKYKNIIEEAQTRL
jgi:hypothetical protein